MQELNAVPESLARLLTQPQLAILIALLVIAAVIDWRTHRIPNWLTFGGMLFGLLYNAVAGLSPTSGLLNALAGLGFGLIALLPLYVLRVMGAGDVKLMAMVGAFVGFPNILFAVLWTLIAGGAAALAFAVWHRASGRLARNLRDIVYSAAFAAMAGTRPVSGMPASASIGKLPYGVSISVGTVAWLAAQQLGLA